MTTTTYTSQNGTTVTIEYAALADETASGTILASVTVTNPTHAISDVYLMIPPYIVDANGNELEDLIAYSTDGGTTTSSYNSGLVTGGANSFTFQLVAIGDIDFSDFELGGTLDLTFVAGLDDFSIYDEFDPVAVTVEEEIENTAPSNIALSATTIAENSVLGAVIGELSATDAEGDTLTYSLDDDANGLFSLTVENGVTKLAVNGALDYESATSHDIVVKVFDGENTVTKTFTIDVTDIDENVAPTDIGISNTTIKESARTGFEVGVLSATDPDGDSITWSLVDGQGDNDNSFKLRTNDDGSVSVVLKNPLNHESVGGGLYDLVVKATDSNGHETISTIEITAEDDPLKFSGSPTGKDYTAVVETAKVGQEVGYLSAFDADFDIASAILVDDADGAFKITSRVVEGVTRYYLATAKKLDHETLDSHSVTFQATDTNGNTYQKTIDVNVLDAAETGDTARGRITIDAATALAGKNGGVNWNTYLADYHDKLSAYLPAFLPNGTGWSQSNPSSEFLFGNGESFMSMRGSNFVYNWTDPVTGEDAHVVSGNITDLVFGAGKDSGSDIGITEAELTISGLDLSNDSTPLNRIFGEVNVLASAFMHGLDAGYPAEIEYVKALLASYAQTFNGSAKADTYTGTIFNDVVRGNAGVDTVNGAAGNDKLWGGNGADIIKGGAGNDHLYGGAASDKLYGNAGADIFHFTAISDSRKNAFDTIYDFDGKGGDRIALSDIDANSSRGGNQAFTFIGSQDFHRKAGELHFDKVKGDTVVEGDLNGDGKADFVLHLDDAMSLKADYFIL